MPRGIRWRCSASIPGRIAAAMMNPRNTSEMTSLSFQSASATRTTPPATSVTTRAFRAVCASTQGFCGPPPNAANPMWSSQRERVCLEERLHPALLAPSFARALGLAGLGALLSQLGWFLTPLGAALVRLGAFVALVAVGRWERTRLVVTTDKIYVVHGTFRRRAAGVRLGRAGAIEVEQTVLGR